MDDPEPYCSTTSRKRSECVTLFDFRFIGDYCTEFERSFGINFIVAVKKSEGFAIRVVFGDRFIKICHFVERRVKLLVIFLQKVFEHKNTFESDHECRYFRVFHLYINGSKVSKVNEEICDSENQGNSENEDEKTNCPKHWRSDCFKHSKVARFILKLSCIFL